MEPESVADVFAFMAVKALPSTRFPQFRHGIQEKTKHVTSEILLSICGMNLQGMTFCCVSFLAHLRHQYRLRFICLIRF
jgi:hypothetical protein